MLIITDSAGEFGGTSNRQHTLGKSSRVVEIRIKKVLARCHSVLNSLVIVVECKWGQAIVIWTRTETQVVTRVHRLVIVNNFLIIASIVWYRYNTYQSTVVALWHVNLSEVGVYEGVLVMQLGSDRQSMLL